jgi:hypothetical protein
MVSRIPRDRPKGGKCKHKDIPSAPTPQLFLFPAPPMIDLAIDAFPGISQPWRQSENLQGKYGRRAPGRIASRYRANIAIDPSRDWNICSGISARVSAPNSQYPRFIPIPECPGTLLTCSYRYQGEAIFMRDMLQIFCKKVRTLCECCRETMS